MIDIISTPGRLAVAQYGHAVVLIAGLGAQGQRQGDAYMLGGAGDEERWACAARQPPGGAAGAY